MLAISFLRLIKNQIGGTILEAMLSGFFVTMSAYAVMTATELDRKNVVALHRKYIAQSIAENITASYAAQGRTALYDKINNYQSVPDIYGFLISTGYDTSGQSVGVNSSFGPEESWLENWENGELYFNPVPGIGPKPAIQVFIYFRDPNAFTGFSSVMPFAHEIDDYDIYVSTEITYERFNGVTETVKWTITIPSL